MDNPPVSFKKIAQEIVQFFPCQLVRIIIYDFQS